MKRQKKTRAELGFIPVIIFLVVWEIFARFDLMPGQIYFPPFSMVLLEFWHLILNGVLFENFLSSLMRVLAGFIAGSILGIVTGIIMGWQEKVYRWFSPLISLAYPIPALGWLPVLMLWIGINELLPIAIIFICSFFPVLYNTITGIRQVNRNFIDAARLLGASDLFILRKVVLPQAVPNIFTGLRLESGMAWRVIIAAEMIAIPTGIGALMMRAESLVRIDIIIVCLMILSVMCLLFERIFALLEARLTSKWR